MNAGMTIGELASRTGLTVSAIRFYQRRGLLPPPTSNTSWQRFDDDALRRLAILELAKRCGFSLDDIQVLLQGLEAEVPAAEWRPLLEAKLVDLDTQIVELEHMRGLATEALSCDCLKMERVALVPAVLGWVENARRDPTV